MAEKPDSDTDSDSDSSEPYYPYYADAYYANNYLRLAKEVLSSLNHTKADLQQKLLKTTSDVDKTQLQDEIRKIKKNIPAAISVVERYTVELENARKRNADYNAEVMRQRKEESKRLFDEAKKEGVVMLDTKNVILSGVAGSGKTSIMDLLTGKEPRPPSERTSTPCKKKPVRIRPVSKTQFKTAGDVWEEISQQELINLVASFISVHRSGEKVLGVNQKSTAVDLREDINSKKSAAAVAASPTPVDQAINEVTDLVIEAMSKEKKKNEERILLHSQLMHLADCGGQLQFQDVSPLFTRHTSAALLVSRLIDDLSCFPQDEFFKDGKLVGTPFTSHKTHGETVIGLLRSLRSHNKRGKNPSLLFIGTFLDELAKLADFLALDKMNEALGKKNKALREILAPEILEDVIYSDEGMEKLIFAVNTLSRDDSTLAMAVEIRKAVESVPPHEVPVPIGWFLLQLALQKLSSTLNRGVLTKYECQELAIRLGFEIEAVDAALDFFDEVGISHYYPAILPDTVFVDAQVPLDKVSELAEYAISLRDAKKCGAHQQSTPKAMNPKKWKRFRDQGIVTLDILQSEEFNSHYESNPFTPADLLKIMQQLLIVAPRPEEEYFMPTLLSSLPPPDLEKHRVFGSLASPLLIQFPSNCIRCGVFCCLVVQMITKYKWQICKEKSDDPILLTKNCVKFLVPGYYRSVTLIDSFAQIEVHFNPRSETNAIQHCPTIRENLLKGVNEACQALHYNNDHPVSKILCPGPHQEGLMPESSVTRKRHAATVNEDGFWICTVQPDLDGVLQPSHKVWWGKQVIRDSPPTKMTVSSLKEHFKLSDGRLDRCIERSELSIVGRTFDNWMCYAGLLGLDDGQRHSIHSDLNLTSHAMKAEEALKVWWDINPIKATFRNLLKIVVELNKRNVAMQICAYLVSKIICPGPHQTDHMPERSVTPKQHAAIVNKDESWSCTAQPDLDRDLHPTPPTEMSVSSLKNHFKLSDEQLDRCIERSELSKVGRSFDNWMCYAGLLRLDDGQRQTIHSDVNLTSNAMRAEQALKMWWDFNPIEATFRNLLNIVVELNKGNVAMKICAYLAHTDIATRPLATLD